MGVWGIGPFENDDAADFLTRLNKADPDRVIEIIEQALSIPPGHLEYDDGATAVAAAAVVAYATGAHGPTALVDLVDHPFDPPPELREHAIRALQQVLTGDSELRGLWAEATQLDELTRQFDMLTRMLRGAE
jgi:hypothetical protein